MLLREIPARLRQTDFCGTAVLAGGRLIDFEPQNTEAENFAVATDVGTTTLVAALLDLNTGNETQITGDVNFDTTGVVWTGPYDMYYYQYASGELTNLTEVINAASYAFNGTYDLAHGQLEMGYTRLGSKLVYESLSGIYLFDLVSRAFVPIILTEREWDIRVTWRGPVILDDGTLFVTGLESESGSVGSEGPVWMIEHPALMQ